MHKKEIIEKIKKCLALSQSCNQHEAAIALRQAQALMEKYNIDANDAELLGIDQSHASGGGANNPPVFEVMLAQSIAKMMDCEVILAIVRKRAKLISEWKFVGFDPSAEIASYIFDVLYRQLKKARADFIKTQLKRVKIRTNKIKRADLFCEGWVLSATEAARKVKPDTEKLKQIEAYTKESMNLTEFDPTNRNEGANLHSSRNQNDYWSGREAGKNTQISHAMNGQPTEQLKLGM